MEIWKDIPGYTGWYQVSDMGRVRSMDREITRNNRTHKLKGKILKEALDKQKYHMVGLHCGGVKIYKVHRLVLSSFEGECRSDLDVRHKDGNPENNVLANLQYGTRKENHEDGMRHGTYVVGEDSKRSKLKEIDVECIKIRICNGESCNSISKDYGVSHSTIDDIKHNRSWAWLVGGDA